VRDTTPLGDPGLDAALAAAVTGTHRTGTGSITQGAEVRAWMAASPPGFVTARFERLAEAGLLRGERYMLLMMVPRTAYRLANETALRRFEYLRAHLHAAVTGTSPLNADQLALASLVHAAGIARFAYPGAAGAAARQRLESLAKQAEVAAVAETGPQDAVPYPGVDPNLLFPSHPGSAQHHPSHAPAPQPVHAAAAAVSSAVQAAVAASVSAAVAATVDSATHHHHSSSDFGSGSSDSGSTHHHH
jgi:hypothetical protein